MKFSSVRLLLVFLGLIVLGASSLPSAHAQTRRSPGAIVEVFPGENAIRKGLRRANPGDTINIHAGTYNEKVKIKKQDVTLKAAGDGDVIIDAECEHAAVITLDAEGITVKGLIVRGGTFFAINLENRNSGVIRNNAVENTCEGAEYGVNVFNGGSIKVIGNSGFGWDDAVVYIGGINSTPNGALMVKKNETHDSVRGIIIEDSDNVNVQVLKNIVYDNTLLGILIHNSDNVLIRDNTVTDNAENGIFLDEPSEDNQVIGNTFTGQTIDINNEGSDNCFSGNTYTTSAGPIEPCT